MFPDVYVKSSDNIILNEIVECLTGIDARLFFIDHIGSNQRDQRVDVALYQRKRSF